MAKTLTLSEAKARLSELVATVEQTEEELSDYSQWSTGSSAH